MRKGMTLRLPKRYFLPLTYRLFSSLIKHDFLPAISKKVIKRKKKSDIPSGISDFWTYLTSTQPFLIATTTA